MWMSIQYFAVASQNFTLARGDECTARFNLCRKRDGCAADHTY